MPAKSRAQQRLFGAVAAYQAGKLKNPSAKIKEMAERVSMEDAEDFARTKHKGLPEKKEAVSYKGVKIFSNPLRMREYLKSLGADVRNFGSTGDEQGFVFKNYPAMFVQGGTKNPNFREIVAHEASHGNPLKFWQRMIDAVADPISPFDLARSSESVAYFTGGFKKPRNADFLSRLLSGAGRMNDYWRKGEKAYPTFFLHPIGHIARRILKGTDWIGDNPGKSLVTAGGAGATGAAVHAGLSEKKASRGRILLSALQRMPSSSDEIVSLIRNSLLRQHAAIPSNGSELDFLRTVLNDRITGSPFSLYARLLRAPRFKSVIPPKPKPGIMQKVMQYVKPDSDSADKVVRDWRKFLSDGRPETTAMLSPVFQKAHKLSDKKASAKQEFSQPENWAWMEAVCMFKRAADPEAVYNKVLAPGYDPTRLLQAASSHKAWKGVSGVLARNYARSLDASDSAGLQSKVKALNKEKVIKFIRDNASLFENAGTRQPVAALKLSAAQRLHATWVLKEASGILTDDQVRWQGGIPGMDRGIENAAKWMKQKAWDAGWGLGGVLFKPKPLPITSPAQKTQQPRVNAGG